ncbi:MAG: hypothetical protein AAF580_05925 [Pseudomonadota bacterium]
MTKLSRRTLLAAAPAALAVCPTTAFGNSESPIVAWYREWRRRNDWANDYGRRTGEDLTDDIMAWVDTPIYMMREHTPTTSPEWAALIVVAFDAGECRISGGPTLDRAFAVLDNEGVA